VNAFEAYSVQRPFRRGAKRKNNGSCRSLTARVTINAPSERRTQELSPSYRTVPISRAASSQTQIGSSPFWNFRQRGSHQLRHKIAKSVNVVETDSQPALGSSQRKLKHRVIVSPRPTE
jgi:hypothetical protein